MALVASTTTVFAVAEPANGAAACTPADAPPRVLAVHAEDVTFSRPFEQRAMHVTVQNTCGGTSTYECDNTQPTTSCTGVELRLRRSGTVGTQARDSAATGATPWTPVPGRGPWQPPPRASTTTR
jgi:hypothetical protein